MAEISAQAVVEPTAVLADDVRVGPFAYVGPQVRIGRGCIIENNATVTGNTTLGERTHVFPLSVVGASPDGGPARGECIIGPANAIRELVTIYAGTGKPTRIGQDNLIMIGSVVSDGATLGDHGIFANCTNIGKGAVVEDYVRTSAFPVIGDGVRVGAYTFVNGYAWVDQDVPPFAIVEGSPVRVRGVNAENLKRCGFGERDIRLLKETFRELYDGASGQADPQAMSRLVAQKDLNPNLKLLIDWIRGNARHGGEHA